MSNNLTTSRSKQKLISAFEVLLKNFEMREISVTKLCNEAGLSRPAFYHNFDSVNDVATMCIASHAKKSYEYMKHRQVESPKELAEFFVEISDFDENFMRLAISRQLVNTVIIEYTKLFAEIGQTKQVLNVIISDQLKESCAAFIGAGSAAALADRMSTNKNLSRREIVDVLTTLISSTYRFADEQAKDAETEEIKVS